MLMLHMVCGFGCEWELTQVLQVANTKENHVVTAFETTITRVYYWMQSANGEAHAKAGSEFRLLSLGWVTKAMMMLYNAECAITTRFSEE